MLHGADSPAGPSAPTWVLHSVRPVPSRVPAPEMFRVRPSRMSRQDFNVCPPAELSINDRPSRGRSSPHDCERNRRAKRCNKQEPLRNTAERLRARTRVARDPALFRRGLRSTTSHTQSSARRALAMRGSVAQASCQARSVHEAEIDEDSECHEAAIQVADRAAWDLQQAKEGDHVEPALQSASGSPARCRVAWGYGEYKHAKESLSHRYRGLRRYCCNLCVPAGHTDSHVVATSMGRTDASFRSMAGTSRDDVRSRGRGTRHISQSQVGTPAATRMLHRVRPVTSGVPALDLFRMRPSRMTKSGRRRGSERQLFPNRPLNERPSSFCLPTSSF